jgi:hypothetical protein
MADASTKGSGWVTYAGIMIVVAGFVSILDAIWAFRYDDTLADLVLFEDDLAVWGWIWLILGVLLLVAGFGIFSGETWARWTGIVFASLAILSNLSWAQVQPQQGLIGAILAALVVYGLAAHGDSATT